MSPVSFRKIPASGQPREQLRQKGQFWTPDWVADAMVEYVLSDQVKVLFDPAVGTGAFFHAAKRLGHERGVSIALSGMELDPTVLERAIEEGLSRQDISGVKVDDFVFHPITKKLAAIVANPPYIRHHRLSVETKKRLKGFSLATTGKALDGRAGLHVYFLIRSLSLLEEGGRLAFILPADTCEGKFAPHLWHWITNHYTLDAVVTFDPLASPFPKIDTNPLIVFIRKEAPTENFLWAICHKAQTDALKVWVHSGFSLVPPMGLTVTQRQLAEGLKTGFSRPCPKGAESSHFLGDFAKIVRGVATGANQFFFMTEEQVKETDIPTIYFTRAIGRTRDVPTDEITQKTLDVLDAKGRPTYLLTLNGEEFEGYPESLKAYLKIGETLGLPDKPLISQRKPWFKTEFRLPPPFLFAYLGRRNTRFIRNTARIIPLTGFLCVYPKSTHRDDHERLWAILQHPDTLANLALIGKSYGGGAVKVEPRALEKLPLPEHLIEQVMIPPQQLRLFEADPVYQT